MIEKRVLCPSRLRRPPASGFSWVDRGFVRELAPGLSRDAILLYFFYCAVADKDGLSFWGEAATASRLRLEKRAVVRAREELLRRDLIAYEPPLIQVLSLPSQRAPDRNGGAALLRDLFRDLGRGEP